MLEDQGASVTVARSAAEGYEMLTRARPDVVVCDIGMPDENGLAFITRVRNHTDAAIASVPALAVTAYARAQDRQRSLLAGFHSYLSKPFPAAELVGIIRHLAHFKEPADERRSSRRAT